MTWWKKSNHIVSLYDVSQLLLKSLPNSSKGQIQDLFQKWNTIRFLCGPSATLFSNLKILWCYSIEESFLFFKKSLRLADTSMAREQTVCIMTVFTLNGQIRHWPTCENNSKNVAKRYLVFTFIYKKMCHKVDQKLLKQSTVTNCF